MSPTGREIGTVYVNVTPEVTRDVLNRLLLRAINLRDTSLAEPRRDVAELFRRWIYEEMERLPPEETA